MAIQRAILIGGLLVAALASAYWTRFDVRGISVDDNNDSGGRASRPIWDPPRTGSTVEFVRHSGMVDMVRVERATVDVAHSIIVFAGFAVAFVVLASLVGPRSRTTTGD